MTRSLLFMLALGVASAQAAGWRIETVAGTGVQGHAGNGGPALEAQLDNPFGLVRGPDDDLWFCEYTGHRIRKITAEGLVVTIAGNGQAGYSGDGGPALQASFNQPHEIRFDSQGRLHISDMRNQVLRCFDPARNMVETCVGSGATGYSGDQGPARLAALNYPISQQFAPDGRLYFCDIRNHVIRRVDFSSDLIETFAGTGTPGATQDGAPISGTPLEGPRSLDFDQQGHLWLCTREGNQVFEFDLQAGTLHHRVGTGKKGFSGHGADARLATLNGPKGITIDAAGNVWLADTENHSIVMLEKATGHLLHMAGTGAAGDGPDGDPLQCALNRPHGIFVDRDGSIYIGDSEAHKIRRLYRDETASE